jgi:hypothetical protein
MIYECTDCRWCANFSDGFRVFCLHKNLPPQEVCKYYPVGEEDADRCWNFDENEYYQEDFSWDDFTAAEKYSGEKYDGAVTYKGIREWCEQEIILRKKK